MGSFLWIIECPGLGDQAISPKLFGNCEVRLFASWRSFIRLVRCQHHSVKPGIVLLRMRNLQLDLDFVDGYLKEFFPRKLRVFLGDSNHVLNFQKTGRILFPDHICPFKLSSQLKNLSRVTSQYLNEHIHYKDLTLDPDNFEIINESGCVTKLTMKEGQLLKFFMRTPGKCFSRDDLKRDIWDGLKVSSRTIDSQVSRLRKALAGTSVTIESLYRQGYVLS